VGGELGIRAVDLRVVKVRLAHPGAQVVRDLPGRGAAEIGERLDVRLDPSTLIHGEHRTHEHVPGRGQDHHERPDPAPPPANRVDPVAQMPVVDLRLRTGLGLLAPHDHLGPAGILGQVRPHIPAKRRHAALQAVLVAQPLPDRRHPHHTEHRFDVVVVLGDLRPRRLPQPRIRELREPAPQ
jgi:hypothetical protein